MTPLRCEPNSRKNNRKQRCLYFHVSASETTCFRAVLQCQINDAIRRQKEEAQIGCAVSGEVDTNQDVGRRNVPLFTANFMVNGRFFSTCGRLLKELWLSSVWWIVFYHMFHFTAQTWFFGQVSFFGVSLFFWCLLINLQGVWLPKMRGCWEVVDYDSKPWDAEANLLMNSNSLKVAGSTRFPVIAYGEICWRWVLCTLDKQACTVSAECFLLKAQHHPHQKMKWKRTMHAGCTKNVLYIKISPSFRTRFSMFFPRD